MTIHKDFIDLHEAIGFTDAELVAHMRRHWYLPFINFRVWAVSLTVVASSLVVSQVTGEPLKAFTLSFCSWSACVVAAALSYFAAVFGVRNSRDFSPVVLSWKRGILSSVVLLATLDFLLFDPAVSVRVLYVWGIPLLLALGLSKLGCYGAGCCGWAECRRRLSPIPLQLLEATFCLATAALLACLLFSKQCDYPDIGALGLVAYAAVRVADKWGRGFSLRDALLRLDAVAAIVLLLFIYASAT